MAKWQWLQLHFICATSNVSLAWLTKWASHVAWEKSSKPACFISINRVKPEQGLLFLSYSLSWEFLKNTLRSTWAWNNSSSTELQLLASCDILVLQHLLPRWCFHHGWKGLTTWWDSSAWGQPGLWSAPPEPSAEKLEQARAPARLWQVDFFFFPFLLSGWQEQMNNYSFFFCPADKLYVSLI